LTTANNLATAIIVAYLADIFIIEIISLTIKIIAFPEVQKKVKDKDAPTFYHLLLFMMAVGSSGSKNGFF
jgi:hypothetical protein